MKVVLFFREGGTVCPCKWTDSIGIYRYTKETIIDMSKKVLEHLAKKYSKVREGVGAVMGGNISEKLRRKIQEEKD